MKNLLKCSIYALSLIFIFTPTYSEAAIQNINTATVVKKILSTDDSLSSIRATAAGKKILSTQLILKSTVGTISAATTIRQSYDAKINATYLEIISSNSQFKMIQRTANGKIERYIFITKSFAEIMLATTGSGAYIPYADKWVLLDDTKITIETVLTDVIKGSIPFSIAEQDSLTLITNTVTKDKSGSIALDLSAATSTVVINIGKIKYTPLAQQDSFTLTYKTVFGSTPIDSSMHYTRSAQKGVSFTIPKMFSQTSAKQISKEIELDAKGTIYSLEQSGLTVGSNLPTTFLACPKDTYPDLSMYCIKNNDALSTAINIYAWNSGATKADVSKIKNDADARKIISEWFQLGDGRTYKDAYTKTINGTFFVFKEEKSNSINNNKLNYFITAYTIKDNKLFKIEMAILDLSDSSVAKQRANLLSFIENNFQKNTTVQVPAPASVQSKSSDPLEVISLNKLQKANISNIGVYTVVDTNPPYAVPVRSGFEFDNQIIYNNSVFIRSENTERQIQVQVNAGGKLGLDPDMTYFVTSSNRSEFERRYKGLYMGDSSTNFNIFKKNGYAFTTYDGYYSTSNAGLYTHNKYMNITRDSLNPSDPYFRVTFSSNKPIDEQLVTEFVEGFTF
ncbi:hypothetical protein H7X65_00270 [Candidatus Parcubacteria bacterium]|nr:hypothetical protein [Candidatus Parcubacteria bacterium]